MDDFKKFESTKVEYEKKIGGLEKELLLVTQV